MQAGTKSWKAFFFGSFDSASFISGSSAIASWVAANFTAKTVGGVTVYDLTQQK